MNTLETKNETVFERLRADMAKWESENMKWQAGLWIAAVFVIGILFGWPSSDTLVQAAMGWRAQPASLAAPAVGEQAKITLVLVVT